MELVSRLTEHSVTPGTLDTAFSTRALQAAQLMPVTLYCFIVSRLLIGLSADKTVSCTGLPHSGYFISFCSVLTSSSITSSLPSRMSCATQVRM